MNKIEKLIKKLSKKEKEAFLLLLLQLKIDHKKVPGIKKLKGKKYIYRVRIGKHRIIFFFKNKVFKIIKISKRSEKTYKNI